MITHCVLYYKYYTKERVNYGKRISRQNSVNCDLLAQANYTNYTLSVKAGYPLCNISVCIITHAV